MALLWRGSGVDLDEALHMWSINLQYSKSGCENNYSSSCEVAYGGWGQHARTLYFSIFFLLTIMYCVYLSDGGKR